MGLLNKLFPKRHGIRINRLPSGAFALDRNGRVVISTLPQSFSEAQMRDIGTCVIEFFRGAQQTQMPLQEVNIYYPSLKVTARNLRGGALVFLIPQNLPTT
jgi:hypothetical protein